jgi:glycolate oxidase FAD binding subunit
VDRFAADFSGLVDSSMMVSDPGRLFVHPRSVDDVVEVLRRAATDGISLGVAGSTTAGNQTGSEVDVVLVTDGLASVIAHDVADLTFVVGAGATLSTVGDTLASHRQTALLPEGAAQRTVGGVVASGDSSYRRLRYGPTRDRVLGITMVTGYGEVVSGGGRLVKNVTGYDLPRLVTGSHGALGVIVDVCLKLWPQPETLMTVSVPDAEVARQAVYLPSAVLETEAGAAVYLEGSPTSVDVARRALGGEAVQGHQWPDEVTLPYSLSVRVPPVALGESVRALRSFEVERFIAQHGVGLIDAGWSHFDGATLSAVRTAIGALGGVVVVSRWPDGPWPDRWGMVPDGIEIQRRLKHLFDPAGVVNVGLLPGGI